MISPFRREYPEIFDGKTSALKNFLDRTVELPNGCWNPALAHNAKGYVPLSIGGRQGKKVRAHRWVYEQLHGPQPAEILIRHDCDNRRCVNPVHLLAGTAKDNTADMLSRCRGANQYAAHSGSWRI